MNSTLLRREVIPFYLSLLTLAAVSLLLDALLHYFNAVWVGRYLGIPGTLLILASMAYSLKKRKLIKYGEPAKLLRWHERVAWLGSLLILVHAGIHFNAILGWLAVWAMLITVGSGLTGKFLLQRARKQMEAKRQQLRDQGLTAAQLDVQMHFDTMTFDAVKQWRAVHFPITLAFAVLALAHIISIFLFWSWR